MARALLKDNVTNDILAQIKFKSISDNIIKAVKVKITSLDTMGNIIDDVVEYTYLDLKVLRNQEFGSKELISVSDITTRSFDIAVQEVIFIDNSIWKYNSLNEQHKLLYSTITLQEHLKNNELVKQYILDNGNTCKYIPVDVDDLWICACGTINHKDEECCCVCKNNFKVLLDGLNFEDLQKKSNIRIAEENINREKNEIERQKAKKKKLIISSIVGAFVVALFILNIALNITWGKMYNTALQLEQETRWEDCLKTYKQIPSFYKDTKQRKELVEYIKTKYDEIGGTYIHTHTDDIKFKNPTKFDVILYLENDEPMVKLNTNRLSAGKLKDNNTVWVEYKHGWKKEYDANVFVEFFNGNITITYHFNNGAIQIDKAIKE